MTDINDVIKGFEQCWEKEPNTRNCDDCPYYQYFNEGRGKCCIDRMHLDALELLKAYKQIIEEEQDDDYDPCYECRGLGDDYIINDDGELESWCDKCGVNPDRMKDDE